MPPGGTRVRSGPIPDPNALRRDRPSDAATWVHLPAAGRTAPAPDWPLTAATQRERQLWEAEWRRPQALMWEANGQAVEVAVYVRALRFAEMPNAKPATGQSRALVVRLMLDLGISAPGLARHRWIIDSEAEQPRDQQRSAGDAAPVSIKDRIRLVAG